MFVLSTLLHVCDAHGAYNRSTMTSFGLDPVIVFILQQVIHSIPRTQTKNRAQARHDY